MIGGNRIIADSLTAYLFRSYIIVLLVGIYASTDLFGNMINRINKTRFRIVTLIVSPVVTVILFAVCTAMISYTGGSENMLIQL